MAPAQGALSAAGVLGALPASRLLLMGEDNSLSQTKPPAGSRAYCPQAQGTGVSRGRARGGLRLALQSERLQLVSPGGVGCPGTAIHPGCSIVLCLLMDSSRLK